MVLLTSSSISVAISGAIICCFTFVLFLSGYVMQQQTVKSLQEALHAPPPVRPTPILPGRFQTTEADEAPVIEVESDGTIRDPSNVVVSIATDDPEVEIDFDASAAKRPVDNLGVAHMAAEKIAPGPTPMAMKSPPSVPAAAPLRLAYVFTASHPSQICSILAFFHQQAALNTIPPTSSLTRLMLYPQSWESDPSNPTFVSALALMRTFQDDLPIVYHPVRTSDVWSILDVRSQLLGELQRRHWDFDRVLYLRTPGLIMHMPALDTALASTTTSMRRNWMPARDDTDPPILLLAPGRGIMTPRGETRGRIISHAVGVEVDDSMAAYLYFDEAELERGRGGKEGHGGHAFERYEREVGEVCQGVDLEGGKEELKRRDPPGRRRR